LWAVTVNCKDVIKQDSVLTVKTNCEEIKKTR